MTYMERVEDYAVRTGMTPEEIIAEALEDWFAVSGAARAANVVVFPLAGNRKAAPKDDSLRSG